MSSGGGNCASTSNACHVSREIVELEQVLKFKLDLKALKTEARIKTERPN